MTNSVLALNESTFEENVNKDITFAVRLWADWCMPCKMMAPIYQALADKITDESLVMAELNVDEYPVIAVKLGVRSIPTVVVFKNGKEVNRSAGMLPLPELEAIICANE